MIQVQGATGNCLWHNPSLCPQVGLCGCSAQSYADANLPMEDGTQRGDAHSAAAAASGVGSANNTGLKVGTSGDTSAVLPAREIGRLIVVWHHLSQLSSG